MPESPSWLLLQELLDRGDPAFVTELRKVHDAEQLGNFASRWFADPRPWARQFLFDYLDLPLNAFRHEALVKRLFKLAEKAGNDALMGRFMVAFDRSVRRENRFRAKYLLAAFATLAEADAWMRQLIDAGAENAKLQELKGRWVAYAGGRFQVSAVLRGEFIRVSPGSTMPREKTLMFRNPRTGARLQFSDLRTRFRLKSWPDDLAALPARLRSRLEQLRLFSIHTRNYLRRRSWRYFRKLGKEHPERFVAALVEALKRYTDDDTADGLALLDNWGLIHVLFHHSPALIAKTTGWTVAPGHAFAELAPAPIYENLWLAAPRALLDLLRDARCRPVRQWAIHLIRRDPAAVLKHLALDELLNLLTHADEEVVALAGEALEKAPGLDLVPLGRWLALLETPNATALDVICGLMAKHVRPEQVYFTEVVRLASSRPVPVARLGVRWLQSKSPQSEDDCRALLGLAEAQAEPVRPDAVRWARQLLSRSPYFRPEWVLELLDSRHEDVRKEGWQWLLEEQPARDSVELWRRLLESPYDDVRLKLVADLEQRVAKNGHALTERAALDPTLVRFLWASVLLNIHRGNRHKPPVVRQIVRRLDQKPDEAGELLPILSVALRSLRGPEWRAGLTGVVELLERWPELGPEMQALFPELQIPETIGGA
jgi:hypothetical protein